MTPDIGTFHDKIAWNLLANMWGLDVLKLEQLRNPSDQELAHLDIAAVDLACALGLPGSESLDAPACLAWIDSAAEWVRRYTRGIFDRFVRSPDNYDRSEGTFRIVALMSVLKGGLGVHYNKDRLDTPEDFSNSGDSFLHGIISGRGGTCASLPVLTVAIGRRLGYPLKLVLTARHQFARWDDPERERFNIEIGNGLNTYPDDYYLDWPMPIRDSSWREETKWLRSLSPREGVAQAWLKRGQIWLANDCLREAIQSYATASSVDPENRLLDRCFMAVLKRRRAQMKEKVPLETPPLRIYFPHQRRYPGLNLEMERVVLAMETVEDMLDDPVQRRALADAPTGVTCYIAN